jgi:N-acetylmuramoyl-L-alanine amidase
MIITSLPFAAAVDNQNVANDGFNKDISKNMISNDANTNHNLKTVKVNAKTVTKKVRHSYSKKSLASYRIGRGTGDCWQNSEILYNQLKSSGQSVRIIQYRTSLSPRHRSVQICQNGGWVDYNYKANGYAKLYYACKNKPGACVIK